MINVSKGISKLEKQRRNAFKVRPGNRRRKYKRVLCSRAIKWELDFLLYLVLVWGKSLCNKQVHRRRGSCICIYVSSVNFLWYLFIFWYFPSVDSWTRNQVLPNLACCVTGQPWQEVKCFLFIFCSFGWCKPIAFRARCVSDKTDNKSSTRSQIISELNTGHQLIAVQNH